jgi:4-aminobutyrate aminotransferase-like enzyme
VEKVAENGDYLRKKLEALAEVSPLVGEVRGKGLFQGVELVSDKAQKRKFSAPDPGLTDALDKKFIEKGMLIRIGGYHSDTLYFSPPLIIKKDEIDKMCRIAAEVLQEIGG